MLLTTIPRSQTTGRLLELPDRATLSRRPGSAAAAVLPFARMARAIIPTLDDRAARRPAESPGRVSMVDGNNPSYE